jgi:hypothetical protein
LKITPIKGRSSNKDSKLKSHANIPLNANAENIPEAYCINALVKAIKQLDRIISDGMVSSLANSFACTKEEVRYV